MNKPYIICAAIHFDDGKEHNYQPSGIKTGYVVCGRRHHNCFITVSLIRNEDFKKSEYGKVTQGFLTSDNLFVERKRAGIIAYNSGQITKETDCLFSEDLY